MKIAMEEIENMTIEIAKVIEKVDPGFVDSAKGDALTDAIQQLIEEYYDYPLHRNYN